MDFVLDQILAADNYRGERVRLSGFVKAKFIAGWAGLWMRVKIEMEEI
jgi:hypothetical protein